MVISAPKRENRTQRNGLDIVKLTHLGARWRSQSISSHLLLVFNFFFLVQNAQQGSSHLVRWFTASSHGRSAYAKAEIESLPHGLIFVRTSSHFCSGAIFSFFFHLASEPEPAAHLRRLNEGPSGSGGWATVIFFWQLGPSSTIR